MACLKEFSSEAIESNKSLSPMISWENNATVLSGSLVWISMVIVMYTVYTQNTKDTQWEIETIQVRDWFIPSNVGK